MVATHEFNVAKNKSSDRLVVLRRMEGKPALSSTGLTDNRIFTGDNKLHIQRDENNCMWFLHFDSGVPPNPFKQYFTSFSKALEFVKEYYRRRNIEIVEIID